MQENLLNDTELKTKSSSRQIEPLVIRQPQSIATNEDCMDVMKRYPDKFFALAIVDPPYGLFKWGFTPTAKKRRGTLKNSNCKFPKVDRQKTGFYTNLNGRPKKEYFDELFRVSRNQIIWGMQYFVDRLRPTNSVIFWDKENGESNFSDFELAWTSFECASKKITQQRDTTDRIHPTQKPIELYDKILVRYSKLRLVGSPILDTHLGSGSSRIACHKAGLDFVGCEIDKDYYNAQEKRFANYMKQLPMQFAGT